MTSKALFLDRDGIINIDHGYAYKPEQIDFVPGIFDLCALFQSRGYLLIVVTNQSGIARGFYTEQDVIDLSAWMTQVFAQKGITITEFFYCPHHPEKGQGIYTTSCDCRKPSPGMLLNGIEKYRLVADECIMIGDKESDMLAAHRAGLQRGYWIDNGKSDSDVSNQLGNGFATYQDMASVIQSVRATV